MDIAAVGLLFVFGLPALLVLRGVLRLYNIARILDEWARPRLDALSLAVYVRLRVWSTRAARWHRYHSIKGSRYRRQWRHSPKETTK